MHPLVNSFRRTLLALAAVVAALLAAPAALAQAPLVEDLTGIVRQSIQADLDDEALARIVDRLYDGALAPEQAKAAQDMLRAVFHNEQFPEYVARLVLPLARQNASRERVNSAMAGAIAALSTKGMLRLPTERQVSFLAHMLSMTATLNAEVCAAVFLGGLPEGHATRLERRYLAGLTAAQFRDVLTLYTEAAISELEGFPGVRSYSAVQMQAGEQAHFSAAFQRMRDTMSEQSARRVLRNMRTAPEGDVCTFMRNFMQGALDLKEPERSWAILNVVKSMQ